MANADPSHSLVTSAAFPKHVGDVSRGRDDGVWLRIEPQPNERQSLSVAPLTQEQALSSVTELLVTDFGQGIHVCRGGFNALDVALCGARDMVLELAEQLLAELAASPFRASVSWRLLFTMLRRNEAERSLRTDPGYDLSKRTQSNLIAWITPYPGDDWESPQRYPTVQFPSHIALGL